MKVSDESVWHSSGHWRINDNYKVCIDKEWQNIQVVHEDENEIQCTINHATVSINDDQIEQNSINFILDAEYVNLYFVITSYSIHYTKLYDHLHVF